MPVTVVVGGQFGSEGKGKVAKYLAENMGASVAIRCGGPNSGHTVIDDRGNVTVFKQLPTASLLPNIICILCAGSYIDLNILQEEIKIARLDESRLFIDPNAVIVTQDIKARELSSGLKDSIGSTASGTGEAVIQRVRRTSETVLAKNVPELQPYLKEVRGFLREELNGGKRVIVEGTQGHGLSLLHSPFYPRTTSRDTSAAGFISEVGLSPLDVDDVVLVIRTFPIRVAGDSGPLPNETTWQEVTRASGSKRPIEEKTSVTKNVRRVAFFDAQVVSEAILTNNPTRIFLNHLDYIDMQVRDSSDLTVKALNFVNSLSSIVRRPINGLGTGPNKIVEI